MGIKDYEEYIMVKCSPIVHYNGKDVFLANVSLLTEEGGKFCGIQFPQKHLSYCRGFTQEDIDELMDSLSEREEELRKEASLLPPLPEDIPLEELGLV